MVSSLAVNSFENFPVNRAKQFVPCTHDGYIIGDGILFHLAENSLVFVGRAPCANWIQFHAETGKFDVEVYYDDRSPSAPMGHSVTRRNYRFQIQGPNAKQVIEKLNGGPFPALKFFHTGTVKVDDTVSGVSMFTGYSFTERTVLSLATVDAGVSIGDEVTVTWGEPEGGTQKPTVERHEQIEVRAMLSPVHNSKVAREIYAGGGVRVRNDRAVAEHPGDKGFPERLADYSAEVTTPGRKSLDAAAERMPSAAGVYVAALPKGTPDRQIEVCTQVREFGRIPVPHMVARNIENRDTLDQLLGRLSREAGVDRADSNWRCRSRHSQDADQICTDLWCWSIAADPARTAVAGQDSPVRGNARNTDP